MIHGRQCIWFHYFQICIDRQCKGWYSSSWGGGSPTSELWDVTCHMGSHSVTCHPTQVNAPHLTPAMQAGTPLTYPRGMEGWVDLVDLIAPRPGVELATFRSRVRCPSTAPPRQLCHLSFAVHMKIHCQMNACRDVPVQMWHNTAHIFVLIIAQTSVS